MDVRQAPPDDLMVAMRLASQWDDIAKQYATDFHDVFDLSERLDTYRRFESLGWFESLVRLQIERLSSHGDTLIARKNDPTVVDEVKELATKVLHSDFPAGKEWCSRPEWERLDRFLRADQHQRNPGTTADLLAAAILVSLLCDTMQRSEPHSIP
jgi:triphosphoribosyl-dephospho-CoA synthase